ncbi:hypothetical protein ACP70R_049352 [Stipagrostis hirtigluma subsp. patula]
MTRHPILYVIVLLVLLDAPLTNASRSQAALLRKFIRSQARSVDRRPAENHPWADPVSSFGHLPTRYENPSGSKAADRIAALPGQPPRVGFEQYAGYVTVDEGHGRQLFYYFAESPDAAASKPLLLWLNGGPAGLCSSLGLGAMQGIGPFRVNPDGKTLSRNKHAWNNVANVIFVEFMAGAGFSYSNTMSDYEKSGDHKTALDAYIFMLHWQERFPEYKGRDFYIGGEYYAGHHAPQLATVIVAIRKITGENHMNLKGIIVGNPKIESNNGYLEFMWSHGVISDEVYANITKRVPCPDCEEERLFDDGNINYYNMYAPICIQSPNETSHSSSYFPGYDPCFDDYVNVYFNNLEVKKAIHARINTNWSLCANMSWDEDEGSMTMVPTLSWLVETGLRVWLYSGDMSIIGSLTATRHAIKQLKLAITKPWCPWYAPADEVGGFIQQYERGFTFASVRGAGCGVASFQPERSFVLFYSFLKGILPPMASSGVHEKI